MRMTTGEQLREMAKLLPRYEVTTENADVFRARIAELEAELAALKAKAAVPDGWKLVAVNGSFSDLIYQLDQASENSNLDMVGNLAESWESFDYEYLDNPSTPEQE